MNQQIFDSAIGQLTPSLADRSALLDTSSRGVYNFAYPRRTGEALPLPRDDGDEDRMTPEDVRTWSLTYSLSIDVYMCADRYLMEDLKAAIADSIVNSFETAGLEAPAVLESCRTLRNLSPLDPLYKKVFFRVGFLQSRLYRIHPEETKKFFEENTDIAPLIMREMTERIERTKMDALPAVEVGPANEDFAVQRGPDRVEVYDRW